MSKSVAINENINIQELSVSSFENTKRFGVELLVKNSEDIDLKLKKVKRELTKFFGKDSFVLSVRVE